MSREISFDYRQFCWFQPLIGDYIDLQMETADLKQPLPISRCRRALWIPTIMWGGPIRFRLLVDVEESRAGAELGPHDRREAAFPLHSEGTPYGLMDIDGRSVILTELLAEGDYHAVVLMRLRRHHRGQLAHELLARCQSAVSGLRRSRRSRGAPRRWPG